MPWIIFNVLILLDKVAPVDNRAPNDKNGAPKQ